MILTIIEYDCGMAPPFFEGHHLFLDPTSRVHRLSAKFDKNRKDIILTASLLRNHVEIFAFLRKNAFPSNMTVVNHVWIASGFGFRGRVLRYRVSAGRPPTIEQTLGEYKAVY